MATQVDARISGEISGQVAVGSNIVQNNVAHGGVIYNLAPGEIPKWWRRAAPSFRPRRPPFVVGRERDMASALADLANNTPVEFVGPAGAGKTTLLKELVHQAPTSTCPDGVVYHESHNELPEDTLQYLFEAFYESNVPFKANEAQIQQALKDIRALIVLDDVPESRTNVSTVIDTLGSANVVLASSGRCLWGLGRSIPLRGLPGDAAVAVIERELGRPLTEEELQTARDIAHAMDHHPLRLLQAGALMTTLGYELAELAHELRKGSPAEQLAQLLRETLDEDQRKVLDLLSALGGATLTAEELCAITGVVDAVPVVESLMQLGMIQAHSPRYSVTLPAPPEDAQRWKAPARAHFMDWVEANARRPEVVLAEAGAVLTVLRHAVRDQAWGEVLRLGRATEGPLLLGRRWGAWREVLEYELTAARSLGDKAAEGWALHQLGTRDVALDHFAAGRQTLNEALVIREELGDVEGARVTRHNLGLTGGTKKPLADVAVAATPFLGLPLLGLVVGGLALLVLVGGIAFAVSRGGNTSSEDRRAAGAVFRVEPSSLRFGGQPVGTSSAPRTVTVANAGTDDTRFERVELTGDAAAAYQVGDACSSAVLREGSACTVSVVFTPSREGSLPAMLVLRPAGGDPLSVPLAGTGASGTVAGLQLEPRSLDFGRQPVPSVSTRRVLLTNTGRTPLELQPPVVTGRDAGAFSMRSSCGTRLAPEASCPVEVTFRPTAAGPAVAALAVGAVGGAEPARVGLTGVGETPGGPDRPQPPPPPPNGVTSLDIQLPSPVTVAYGSSLGPVAVRAAPATGVTLAAAGLPAGVTFEDQGGGSARLGGTALASPGTSTISVTATAPGRRTTTETFTLTISPADLSITWASPLLDVSPGAPAQVRATATLPPGNAGDLTRAQVIFEVENVLSGERTQIGPFGVRPTGEVDLALSPGQLPLGAYTARARLAPGNPYFRSSGTTPTAVLLNTDVVGATVYALSDILNLIKP